MSDDKNVVGLLTSDPEFSPDNHIEGSDAEGMDVSVPVAGLPEQSNENMGRDGSIVAIERGKEAEQEATHDKKTLDLGVSERLIRINDMALSLYRQGKIKEAEPIFREVLTLREKLLGKEDPLTVTSMSDLAWSLYQQRKSKEAELIFQEVLTLREKLLGKEDPLTVTRI
jgi:hypothetical protein